MGPIVKPHTELDEELRAWPGLAGQAEVQLVMLDIQLAQAAVTVVPVPNSFSTAEEVLRFGPAANWKFAASFAVLRVKGRVLVDRSLAA